MKANPATPNQLSWRLRDLIKKSGWSVVEVSRRAHVERYFIYDVLAGKSSNPSAVKLARIAKVLGVPLDALVNPPENQAPAVAHKIKSDAGEPCFAPVDQFVKLNQGNTLRPVDDVLRDVLIHAITFCGGNKTQAADSLGMGRTTFYRKMGMVRELLPQKPKKDNGGE